MVGPAHARGADAVRARRRRRSPPSHRPAAACRDVAIVAGGSPRARRCPTGKRASSPGCAVITGGSPGSSRSAPVPSSWGKRGSSMGRRATTHWLHLADLRARFPGRPRRRRGDLRCGTAASGPRAAGPRGSISPWRSSKQTMGTASAMAGARQETRAVPAALRESGAVQLGAAAAGKASRPCWATSLWTFVLEHIDRGAAREPHRRRDRDELTHACSRGAGAARTSTNRPPSSVRRPPDRRGPASVGRDAAPPQGHHGPNGLRRRQHDVACLHAASRRHASRLPTALRGRGDPLRKKFHSWMVDRRGTAPMFAVSHCADSGRKWTVSPDPLVERVLRRGPHVRLRLRPPSAGTCPKRGGPTGARSVAGGAHRSGADARAGRALDRGGGQGAKGGRRGRLRDQARAAQYPDPPRRPTSRRGRCGSKRRKSHRRSRARSSI